MSLLALATRTSGFGHLPGTVAEFQVIPDSGWCYSDLDDCDGHPADAYTSVAKCWASCADRYGASLVAVDVASNCCCQNACECNNGGTFDVGLSPSVSASALDESCLDDWDDDDGAYWDDAVPEDECLTGGADLFVDEVSLARSIEIEWLSAGDVDPCYIEEGCLAGDGSRKLLRVTTLIANLGCTDFVIGDPPEDVADSGQNGWTWHDCHAHWHYENYAYYAMNDLCDGRTVAWEDRPVVGHKNGWCVMDIDGYKGLGHLCEMNYDCDSQGIGAGCYDAYTKDLDCQWIDITDVPDGDYWLMVATNWDTKMRNQTQPELSYDNNAAWLAVTISGETVITHTTEEASALMDSCS